MGLFVKFSELQDYGVHRVFYLENANIDSSQRNVVFLVRGEPSRHVRTVAGMTLLFLPPLLACEAIARIFYVWDTKWATLRLRRSLQPYVIWMELALY